MHTILFSISGLDITWWQIVGFTGSFLFAGRWVLQVIVSHKKGHSVTPIGFWYMSVVGSIMLLAYFIFGIHDAVGIISNSFPILIALYNIYLITRKNRENRKSDENI